MKRRVWLAAMSSLALASGMAHADQVADIQKKGELIIGVYGSSEPFSFIDPKTREMVGYEVDIGKAIATKLGVKPVIKQLNLAARIPELQQGHVDILAAALTHNKEREPLVDFSLTTYVTGQKVMVKKTSDVKDVPDLAGKRVVTAKGSTMEVNIRKVVPTAVIVTFDTSPQAFVALQQGKAVGFVNDEISLVQANYELGERSKDYRILPMNLSTEPLALGIKKGEAGFKKLVDDTLREMEASGAANQLYEKWFGQQSKLKLPARSFKWDSDKISE